MTRTILITGPTRTDCLRIRDVLRRRFKNSVIRVADGSAELANVPDREGILVVSMARGSPATATESNDLETRIRGTEFLLEATRTLASAQTADSINQALDEVASRSAGVVGEAVFFFFVENGELRLKHSGAAMPEQLIDLLKRMVNLDAQAIRTGLRSVLDKGEPALAAATDAADSELAALAARLDVKSAAAAPIRSVDHAHGVLFTVSSVPNGVDKTHIALLGELAGTIAQALDNARVVAELEEKAYTDGLTGVYNARFFGAILAREVARAERHRLPLSMLMLDVDDFKVINDQQGHAAGNEVLRNLARVLQLSIRMTDFVFRCGGDEFVILLPDTDLNGAYRVGEHIRTRIETTDLAPGTGLGGKITVSIGASEYEPGLRADLLTQRADQALYKAKKALKNKVELYRR